MAQTKQRGSSRIHTARHQLVCPPAACAPPRVASSAHCRPQQIADMDWEPAGGPAQAGATWVLDGTQLRLRCPDSGLVLPALGDSFSRIESLHLCIDGYSPDNNAQRAAFVSGAAQALPRLSDLTLSAHTCALNLPPSLTSLTRLSLNTTAPAGDGTQGTLTRLVSRLKELRVEARNVDWSLYRLVPQNTTASLTTLSISVSEWCRLPQPSSVLALVHLYLTTPRLDDGCAGTLAPLIPQLETFSLQGPSAVWWEELLSAPATKLTHFTTTCALDTELLGLLLSRAPALERLGVGGLHGHLDNSYRNEEWPVREIEFCGTHHLFENLPIRKRAQRTTLKSDATLVMCVENTEVSCPVLQQSMQPSTDTHEADTHRHTQSEQASSRAPKLCVRVHALSSIRMFLCLCLCVCSSTRKVCGPLSRSGCKPSHLTASKCRYHPQQPSRQASSSSRWPACSSSYSSCRRPALWSGSRAGRGPTRSSTMWLRHCPH